MKLNDILDLFDTNVYFEIYTMSDCIAFGTAERLRSDLCMFLCLDYDVVTIRPINKEHTYIIVE